MHPVSKPELDIERGEEKSITVLQHLERIAKIAAGIVAATYVSGYLIETTFPGSFGMQADSIEFRP